MLLGRIDGLGRCPWFLIRAYTHCLFSCLRIYLLGGTVYAWVGGGGLRVIRGEHCCGGCEVSFVIMISGAYGVGVIYLCCIYGLDALFI